MTLLTWASQEMARMLPAAYSAGTPIGLDENPQIALCWRGNTKSRDTCASLVPRCLADAAVRGLPSFTSPTDILDPSNTEVGFLT